MVKKLESSTLDEQRSSLQRKRHANHGRPSKPAPGLEVGASVPTVEEALRERYGSEPMIPRTRPVVGRDLNDLRTRLGGITVTDACWLFGLQRNRWYQLTKSDKPLDDVSLALFARILDVYPELCPIKPVPRAEWVFHWLKEINPNLDQRSFSLLLGREKSAAHRWLKLGAAVSPKIERLFTTMQSLLLSRMNPHLAIEPLVQVEATARGLDVTEGVWSKEGARVKPKRRKAGERGEVVAAPEVSEV